MPGLVPGIHDFYLSAKAWRPGQTRPWTG